MNTRDKIHSAINEHIDIEDTYAYFLTREKSSFSVGTVTLDDFEEWTDSDVADLTDSIMEKINPELNENQLIVLEWLKQVSGTEGSLTRALYSLYHLNLVRKEYFDNLTIDTKEHQLEVRSALRNLSRKQEAQILAAFAEWGMKVVAE